MMNFFPDRKSAKKPKSIRGFVLPLTLVICAIILTISTGISIILVKEIYFSKLSRQSQVAYYAADNGLMCTLMIDDHYIDPATGIGIFDYGGAPPETVIESINEERNVRGLSPLQLSDIRCATSEIFNPVTSGYAVTPFTRNIEGGISENGKTTTFFMYMNLGNNMSRCAIVTVNKTPTYRQVISRGFASCTNITSQIPTIERAIVNTTNNSGTASGNPVAGEEGQQEYTSPGSYSWTVPDGVTSISVVTVGGGGGGASASSLIGGTGGGGGELRYINNYSVTPGTSIPIVVGAGGAGSISGPGGAGGYSSFNGASPLRANGGNGGTWNSTLTAAGGTGGAGGIGHAGGTGYPSVYFDEYFELNGGGGGGAGGYSGDGGRGGGGYYFTGTDPTAGSGGGAGGGGYGSVPAPGGGAGGGGTGILGQGSSGSAGMNSIGGSNNSTGGGGGSGGESGADGVGTDGIGGAGGGYGGGGGGAAYGRINNRGGNGAGGAVRIIWGEDRSFPSTNTN